MSGFLTGNSQGYWIATFPDGSVRWLDDGTLASKHPRNCAKCDKSSLPDGEDACLGHLDDVKFACCGHGLWGGYIVHDDGRHEDLTDPHFLTDEEAQTAIDACVQRLVERMEKRATAKK